MPQAPTRRRIRARDARRARRRERVRGRTWLLVVVVLTYGMSLWQAHIYSTIAMRPTCVRHFELWLTPTHAWPLFGAFSLVTLLLGAWILAQLAGSGGRLHASLPERAAAVASLVVILACASALRTQLATTELIAWRVENVGASGEYGYLSGPDECALAPAIVGRWSLEVLAPATARDPFPALETIDLAPDLRFVARAAATSIYRGAYHRWPAGVGVPIHPEDERFEYFTLRFTDASRHADDAWLGPTVWEAAIGDDEILLRARADEVFEGTRLRLRRDPGESDRRLLHRLIDELHVSHWRR